jgi:hypothetical protein
LSHSNNGSSIQIASAKKSAKERKCRDMKKAEQPSFKSYLWGWTIAVAALCGILVWKVVG